MCNIISTTNVTIKQSIHGVIGVTSWNLLVELSNFEYDRKRFQEGFGDEATVKWSIGGTSLEPWIFLP
jgi:hypothetical protein